MGHEGLRFRCRSSDRYDYMTRYDPPPHPHDLGLLPQRLEEACCANDEAGREVARAWIVKFYKRLEPHFIHAWANEAHQVVASEDEVRQVEARRTLLTLFRLRGRQIAEGRGEILRDIEREAGQETVGIRLKHLVEDIATTIFMTDNPEKALSEILNVFPRKGPKKKNEYRDLMIAVEVEEELRSGVATIEAACDAVRNKLGEDGQWRSHDVIRKAHARIMADEKARAEVKAAIAWRQLQNH